jgi:hypothetical protein
MPLSDEFDEPALMLILAFDPTTASRAVIAPPISAVGMIY